MRIPHSFIRFFAVGFLGLLVDLIVLSVVVGFANLYLARLISFWTAATTTWALNRRFTFKSVSFLDEYIRYVASMLLGGLINYAVYVLTIHSLSSPYAPWLGVVAGSAAGLFVNYGLARYFVFKSSK